jgi:hypothetical protein
LYPSSSDDKISMTDSVADISDILPSRRPLFFCAGKGLSFNGHFLETACFFAKITQSSAG